MVQNVNINEALNGVGKKVRSSFLKGNTSEKEFF